MTWTCLIAMACSNEGIRLMMEEFNIPPHIAIVMKYASKAVSKDRLAKLPFNPNIHSSVRKVFLLSE
jgi:hypothetical protein